MIKDNKNMRLDDVKWPRRRFLSAVAASGLVLAGCSSSGSLSEEPKSQRISVSVTASTGVNPGPSGSAAPLALQIYTLRSAGRFQTLDYFALKASGASTLASDIVDQRNFSIRPGETREITLSATDATALAVAGGYRDIDGARWRSIKSINPDDSKFAVSAGTSSISISRR